MAQLDADRASRRAADLLPVFAVLVLGALVLQTTPLPGRLVGIPFAAGALWTGARLLHALAVVRRAGRPARGWLAVAIGLGLSTLLLVLLAVQLALYPVIAEDERCRAGATTHQAEERCAEETRRRLGGLSGGLSGGSGGGSDGGTGPAARQRSAPP
jgi:uncharacterized membrane protein YgcG